MTGGTISGSSAPPISPPPAGGRPLPLTDVTISQLPAKLAFLGQSVTVSGLVVSQGEGAATIRTPSGDVVVKSPVPLPTDRPVSLQIPGNQTAGQPQRATALTSQPSAGSTAGSQSAGPTRQSDATRQTDGAAVSSAPLPTLRPGVPVSATVIASGGTPATSTAGASAAASGAAPAATTPAATPTSGGAAVPLPAGPSPQALASLARAIVASLPLPTGAASGGISGGGGSAGAGLLQAGAAPSAAALPAGNAAAAALPGTPGTATVNPAQTVPAEGQPVDGAPRRPGDALRVDPDGRGQGARRSEKERRPTDSAEPSAQTPTDRDAGSGAGKSQLLRPAAATVAVPAAGSADHALLRVPGTRLATGDGVTTAPQTSPPTPSGSAPTAGRAPSLGSGLGSGLGSASGPASGPGAGTTPPAAPSSFGLATPQSGNSTPPAAGPPRPTALFLAQTSPNPAYGTSIPTPPVQTATGQLVPAAPNAGVQQSSAAPAVVPLTSQPGAAPPPLTTGQQIRLSLVDPQTPSGRPGDTALLAGHIAGSTTDGRTVVTTERGTLVLDARSGLPSGSAVTLALDSPVAAARGRLQTQAIDLLRGKDWPALKEALAVLTLVDPALAQQVAERAVAQPNRKMAAALINLLAGLKGGDARQLLGSDALTALEQLGRGDLIRSLNDDLRALSRQATQATPDGWTVFTLPFGEAGNIGRLQMHVRGPDLDDVVDEDDEHRQRTGGRAGTRRFLVDVEFSQLGPMQLDGLVWVGHMDLVLRSIMTLPSALQNQIGTIYRENLAAVGFAGTILFQNGAHRWVNVQPGRRSGGDVRA